MKIFNPFIIFHHSQLIGEGVKSDTLLQFGARWSHTLFGHFFGVICCGSHPLPFFPQIIDIEVKKGVYHLTEKVLSWEEKDAMVRSFHFLLN